MTVTVTSFAVAFNVTWPFLKIPDFDRRGKDLLASSGATFLASVPIVSASQRLEWEEWTTQNYNSLLVEDNKDISQFSPGISVMDATGGFVPAPYDSTAYAPLWQITP